LKKTYYERVKNKEISIDNKANSSIRTKSSESNTLKEMKFNLTSDNFNTAINNISRKLSNSISERINDFKNKTINTLSSIDSNNNTLNFINRKNSHEFFLNSLRFNDKESLASNHDNKIKKYSLTKPQSPKLRTKDRYEERNKKNLN